MHPDEHDEHDEQHMRRALALAAEAAAFASPNPQVGCVLVAPHGRVIGEGTHLYAQRDHAEIAALKDATTRGHDVNGATAYVTLEPCSHHGRTGPCADALIAASIARAVVATVDPNPLVSGQGIAKLQAAGIQVTLGVCEKEARTLNEAFAHFIQTRRPFVTLKAALSVDGYLAPQTAQRSPQQPHWLTGPAARAEVQRLRHSSDAILTGIGTVLADDPALTDRSGLLGPHSEPRRRPLLRIVLDSYLRIPLDSQLVRTAQNDLLILCAPDAPQTRMRQLRMAGAEVEVLPAPPAPLIEAATTTAFMPTIGASTQEPRHPASVAGRRLPLIAVLDLLGQRQCLSLLLESGSKLNGSFLAQQLVDRAVLFYAETELGAGSIPFAEDIASPFFLEQQLHTVTRRDFGPDACVSGLLHDPWPATP
jgi:diaminohydroxyphosphoribosylaminopyrimidine deaminase/5-amino-6-(5-phosphoribosylamino)uracil reductase